MKTTTKNIADKEYIRWIADLAQRYRSSQIKAAVKVNDEMLRFYWSVGEDIEKRQYENRYGSHFYENVSKDLRGVLNLNRGMSATTIKYTCYFYRLYSQLFENRQGVIDDFKAPILQQDAEVFQVIFNIPWTHHMCIKNLGIRCRLQRKLRTVCVKCSRQPTPPAARGRRRGRRRAARRGRRASRSCACRAGAAGSGSTGRGRRCPR